MKLILVLIVSALLALAFSANGSGGQINLASVIPSIQAGSEPASVISKPTGPNPVTEEPSNSNDNFKDLQTAPASDETTSDGAEDELVGRELSLWTREERSLATSLVSDRINEFLGSFTPGAELTVGSAVELVNARPGDANFNSRRHQAHSLARLRAQKATAQALFGSVVRARSRLLTGAISGMQPSSPW